MANVHPGVASLASGRLARRGPSVLPGLALSGIVAGGAFLLEACERAIFGRAWLEALVLAILLGSAVRSLSTRAARWHHGVAIAAKYPLEIAVVLLGASLSVATMRAAGPVLILGVAATVGGAILLSLAIGKLARLPIRMALLVACGNSICGNSAIAAVAPVIEAKPDDVATAIAFTAALGVVAVLGLPLLGIALGMSGIAYGALTGLTVYAVPQVIAAAVPFGATAVQVGTLVKLVRVLMLGPVCLVLSLVAPRLPRAAEAGSLPGGTWAAGRRPPLSRLVPWFIVGFLGLAACRASGLVPEPALAPIGTVANLLTILSMAALGLGVDVRHLLRAGGRVTLVVVLSLAGLGAISAVLLHVLGLH